MACVSRGGDAGSTRAEKWLRVHEQDAGGVGTLRCDGKRERPMREGLRVGEGSRWVDEQGRGRRDERKLDRRWGAESSGSQFSE